ncbi:methyltransferase domain-containing protein, partial [Cytidiella melzeri]
PGYIPPTSWLPWWDWSASEIDAAVQSSRWELLWQYYSNPHMLEPNRLNFIPMELRGLVDDARRLQLCRDFTFEATAATALTAHHATPIKPTMHGMSPKKAHEVVCTVDYTRGLLASLSTMGVEISHAVDVGAGQAYLSRALRDDLGLHVLALDWSTVQSNGASRREGSSKKVSKGKLAADSLRTGSLSYETLRINPQSLQRAIDNWVARLEPSTQGKGNVPVLLVALHACGSLTLDILRTFLTQVKDDSESGRWKPAAALVVGCCYNLLAPEDQRLLTGRQMAFVENHLQMAAQAPSQWCRSPEALASTKLSFKKTVWRALLATIVQERGAAQDHEVVGKRLGRINASAYSSWQNFLEVAGQKFGLDLTGAKRDTELAGRVEVFQFLRCILGPVVESCILLDRKLWLKHKLEGTEFDVRLVNLFAQSSGSARNTAIVVEKSIPAS